MNVYPPDGLLIRCTINRCDWIVAYSYLTVISEQYLETLLSTIRTHMKGTHRGAHDPSSPLATETD